MSQQAFHELIGYAASVMVAISLTMSSILRLRVLNLTGALLFSAYGWIIGSAPVLLVNLFIVCVNIFYLQRMLRSRENFRVLEAHHDSSYAHYFLEFHRSDIARFQPDFALPPAYDGDVLLLLRNALPVGIFAGRRGSDGSMLVDVDYVLPDYRDLKSARFLFGEGADVFRRLQVRRLVARASTSAHRRYLERTGFREERNGDHVLELPVHR